MSPHCTQELHPFLTSPARYLLRMRDLMNQQTTGAALNAAILPSRWKRKNRNFTTCLTPPVGVRQVAPTAVQVQPESIREKIDSKTNLIVYLQHA
jgi:hypothetical protein